MANILEVVTKFLGDTKDVDAKIDDTEKRATTVGDRISGAVGKGARLVAGAAAVGFGIATKGLLELESAQANFRSETGATAEEAEKAGVAINGMFRKNVQPIHEIGEALTAVTVKMGLTGDAAATTTQDFLTFGRATKQNAAAAVEAFDNILDAWGLTASDAVGIMDKLVVSHQRYGTSVTGSQEALARLAPQLKALNLSLDDGIGLLNLFASRGLDASVAQRALNTAIQKLPPGTDLKSFIAQLIAIPDPAQRAAKASEIFGNRAGPALANALVPGTKGLESFTVSTTDAAGATKRAATILDNEIGGRVTRALHDLSGALIGAGKDFGPVLTGLAGLGSLAGALGADKLVKSIGTTLVSGLKTVGQNAGEALSEGFQQVWSGAGGTVIGNNIASRIENIMDPEKPTVIGRVVRAVGTRAGAAWGVFFGASTALAEKVGAALMLLPGAPSVAGAIAKSGAVMGAALGTAISLGLITGGALLIAIPLAQWADKGLQEEQAKIKDQVAKAIADGSMEGLQAAAQELEARLRGARAAHLDTMAQFYQDQLNNVRGAMAGMAASVAANAPAVESAAESVGESISQPIITAADAAKMSVKGVLAAILTAFQQFRSDLAKDAQGAADAMFDPQIKAAELAETKLQIAEQTRIINSKKSTKEQVREAELRRLELQKTLFLQISDLTTYGTDAQKIAAIKAALTSKAVADAYKHGTTEQRLAIDAWRATMREQLATLQGETKTGADKASSKFTQGIREGVPGAKKAGGALASAGRPDPPDRGPDSWYQSAVHAIGQFIGGMLSQLGAVGVASSAVAARAHRNLAFSDPPPGPLHNIRQSGQHAAQEWFGGFTDELPRLGEGVAEQVRRFGLMNGTLGVEAQGGLHLYHHVLAEPGALPAGTTAAEVERLLNEGLDATGLLYSFRHAASTR